MDVLYVRGDLAVSKSKGEVDALAILKYIAFTSALLDLDLFPVLNLSTAKAMASDELPQSDQDMGDGAESHPSTEGEGQGTGSQVWD